ncbi:FUSC family protein [Methylobacterium oryzae CBMB20]
MLGAAMSVVLVPNLVNEPILRSVAVALWVALCLYISLLDRTPASYFPMLAGYTAALIGFPAVDDPGAIFDTAVARAEEISLGILLRQPHRDADPTAIGRPGLCRAAEPLAGRGPDLDIGGPAGRTPSAGSRDERGPAPCASPRMRWPSTLSAWPCATRRRTRNVRRRPSRRCASTC